jgi:hypothetical protein
MSLVYDETKVGKKIANGGDRRVYQYGPDNVIKISTWSFLTGHRLHKKLLHDYEVCKKYLPEFVVTTSDATKRGKGHIEIQPYIRGEMLMKEHCRNEKVRLQLERIKNAVDQMIKDGYPTMDLIGNRGVLNPWLSNILIDSENKLHIVDTTLLEGKTVRPFGYILEAFIPMILRRQNHLLEQFLV